MDLDGLDVKQLGFNDFLGWCHQPDWFVAKLASIGETHRTDHAQLFSVAVVCSFSDLPRHGFDSHRQVTAFVFTLSVIRSLLPM